MPSVSIRRPNWLRHVEKVQSRAALSRQRRWFRIRRRLLIIRPPACFTAVLLKILQVQVKAQTVVKLQKMVERSLLTQEEFEIWKRRIMML